MVDRKNALGKGRFFWGFRAWLFGLAGMLAQGRGTRLGHDHVELSQPAKPPSSRNACSSGVVVRPRSTLR